MADIVLKDRNGNDIVYPGVTSIKLNTVDGGAQSFNACDEVEKTIDLDFSAGDMEVSADEGTLLSKVTVEKPETLLPKNVRNGVEVAGVTGEFIGDTEEVTVELALADGDQTVSPSADGKVISSVTITKPANLVPENIAKDVEVAGVTGSLEVPETVETSIELDFSAGAMEVTPESGQSFSAVNIPVPGTLLPENIAEGVDIAGIIGTLTAGSNPRIAAGEYTLSSAGSIKTVRHNLGVIPDFVFVHYWNVTWSSSYYNLYFGTSSKFYEKFGWRLNKAYKLGVTSSYSVSIATDIDVAGSGPVCDANETSVKIGSSAQHMKGTYKYIIIGGLT